MHNAVRKIEVKGKKQSYCWYKIDTCVILMASELNLDKGTIVIYISTA